MYHPCCFQLDIAGVDRSKVNRLQNRIILYIGKFIFGYYLIDSITIRADRDFIRADYSFIIFTLVGEIMEEVIVRSSPKSINNVFPLMKQVV